MKTYVAGTWAVILGIMILAGPRAKADQQTVAAEKRKDAEPEAHSPPRVKLVKASPVEVTLAVRKSGRAAIDHIDIFVTRDNGKTWEPLKDVKISVPSILEDEAAASVARTVSLPLHQEEVIHGFTVVVRNKAGRGKTAPKEGELPQVRIELDKTVPRLLLYAPQPHPTCSDRVVLSWQAYDRNLHETPISLAWAESKKGPWKSIGPEWMANTGKYEWKLPGKIPRAIYLRLKARDKAGNLSRAKTDKPISLDLREPVAILFFADELTEPGKDLKKEKKVDTRIFELRTYTAAPGKLDALNARFREHTNRLFNKHGMTIIGFWMPAPQKAGEEKLIYILAYPSKEAAEKSWKAFRDDPDWKKAREESEKNGRLLAKPPESVYMKPTDYSPIK